MAIKSKKKSSANRIPIAKGSIKNITTSKVEKQEFSKSSGREKMIAIGKKNLEKGKWKPGQSGNPRGTVPRTITGLVKEWQTKGYQQVTPKSLQEALQLLVGMPTSQVQEIFDDKTQPISMIIMAEKLLDPDTNDYMLEKMLDRAHGKPKQSIENSGELSLTLAGGLIALKRTKQREEI